MKCQHPECGTRPSYNYQGQKKGRFCTQHKEDGMVDVKNSTCEHLECGKQPVYNYQGEKKGRFCTQHKEDEMVNVKSSTCEQEGCSKQPSYNYQGQKKGRFCKQHKEDGMVDVINPTCEHLECGKQPVYNYRGEKKGRFCSEHKEEGMINVKSSTCEQEGCDVIVQSSKYDNYCTHCFANLFPHDPRTAEIRTKSKEIQWVNAIFQCFPQLDWIWDQPLYVDFSGGCCATKRRIDLRVLVEHVVQGLFWLCIEIDENQHKGYAEGYEEMRYNDLFVDYSGRYVFLRINPDSFWEEGQKKDPPFEERQQIVMDQIHHLLDTGPQHPEHRLVEVYSLFYDQY